MKHDKAADFVGDWEQLHLPVPDATRNLIGSMVDRHAPHLATLFYEHMLADKDAAPFISHNMMKQRLHASMQNWMRELFSQQQNDPRDIYKTQFHIGEVHARIQMPISLVLRAARL